jgi:hypothetical protein
MQASLVILNNGLRNRQNKKAAPSCYTAGLSFRHPAHYKMKANKQN